MRIDVRADTFRLAEAFTISRGSRTEARVLTVTVEDGAARGRGECVPYARYGETLDSVTAQIRSLPERFDRRALRNCCRPAPRATPSIARCGIWRPRAPAAASGSSPACPSRAPK